MISNLNSINIIDNIFEVSEFLKKSHYTSYFVLVDENTRLLALPILLESFKNKVTPKIIEIKSGEDNKNIESCLKIWNQLTDFNADRKALIINLGGGVLCDIGGFASSAYKRGIDFVNIPTTLLSMVDASIGGKTGINLNLFKNQIGHFYQPKEVYVYTEFLKTLPKTELINGYAEIIKHALINDFDFWNKLKISDFTNLDPIILRSIEIKRDIVNLDPFEKNIRKKLNFGHTIGHALEMLSLQIIGRQLSHGEAVAAGIICEGFISEKLTGLKEIDLCEITDLIKNIFPVFEINADKYHTIFDLMLFDKKNEDGKIKMVLLKSIGTAVIDVEVDKEVVFEALKYYNGVM